MTTYSDADKSIAMLRQVLAQAVPERGESKVQVLRSAMFDLIERGFWRPGDKIPGERELSEILGISLGTVQAALRTLVDSELLVRRRRAGTFVADAKCLNSSVWHFRFRSENGEQLLPWVARITEIESINSEGPWSNFLGIKPDYIRIQRIVRVNDEFSLYSTTYLEGPRFRPLLDIPLDVLSGKNLRVFIHERFNMPTFRSTHRVTVSPIATEVATILGVSPGALGLDMKALSYGFRGKPNSYQRIIIPENPYELELLG